MLFAARWLMDSKWPHFLAGRPRRTYSAARQERSAVKILKPILIGLLALIVLLGLIGLFLPSAAHVERTVSIAAPPAAVYEIVNDLRRFNEWSPWFEKDPNARYTFSGPQRGVGARLQWARRDTSVGYCSQ